LVDTFPAPIVLPDGGELVTLRRAGAYTTNLPKSQHDSAPWQNAMHVLTQAADHGGPIEFARLGMMEALYPTTIRVDQGSEFISRDLDIWAYQKGVVRDFSRPGKPTDNSFIESFNGKFRSECLNTHWFLSLDDARQKMEDWRRDYNEVRPHSVIGNKAPISLLNGSSAPSPV
jgi:transposase InsO family protein